MMNPKPLLPMYDNETAKEKAARQREQDLADARPSRDDNIVTALSKWMVRYPGVKKIFYVVIALLLVMKALQIEPVFSEDVAYASTQQYDYRMQAYGADISPMDTEYSIEYRRQLADAHQSIPKVKFLENQSNHREPIYSGTDACRSAIRAVAHSERGYQIRRETDEDIANEIELIDEALECSETVWLHPIYVILDITNKSEGARETVEVKHGSSMQFKNQNGKAVQDNVWTNYSKSEWAQTPLRNGLEPALHKYYVVKGPYPKWTYEILRKGGMTGIDKMTATALRSEFGEVGKAIYWLIENKHNGYLDIIQIGAETKIVVRQAISEEGNEYVDFHVEHRVNDFKSELEHLKTLSVIRAPAQAQDHPMYRTYELSMDKRPSVEQSVEREVIAVEQAFKVKDVRLLSKVQLEISKVYVGDVESTSVVLKHQNHQDDTNYPVVFHHWTFYGLKSVDLKAKLEQVLKQDEDS